MNFLRKGTEYHNLAKSVNKLAQTIMLFERKWNELGDSNLACEIYLLSYLARREILNRTEKYQWDFGTPIFVPSLGGKTTLLIAYQMTIGKIMLIAEQMQLGDDVNEIFDKGQLYVELDKSMPDDLKNLSWYNFSTL